MLPPEPQWGSYAPIHFSVLREGLDGGVLDLNSSEQWKANAVDLTPWTSIRYLASGSSGNLGTCDEVCVAFTHKDNQSWDQCWDAPPIKRFLQTWVDSEQGSVLYARYRGPSQARVSPGASLWTLTLLDTGMGSAKVDTDALTGWRTFELVVTRKVVFSPAQTVPEWRVNGYRLFSLEELEGHWRYNLKSEPSYRIKPAHVVIPVPPDEG